MGRDVGDRDVPRRPSDGGFHPENSEGMAGWIVPVFLLHPDGFPGVGDAASCACGGDLAGDVDGSGILPFRILHADGSGDFTGETKCADRDCSGDHGGRSRVPFHAELLHALLCGVRGADIPLFVGLAQSAEISRHARDGG